MTHSRSGRPLALVLASLTMLLGVVATADAFTTPPVWKCRASAVYASVSDNNRLEPIVANGNINTANAADPDHAQCVSSEAGAGNAATQLGIPQDVVGARSARAKTAIDPELGRSIDQKVASSAGVENLTIQLPQGGAVTLGVNAASSLATGTCVADSTTPKLEAASQVAGLTLNGTPIDLDPLVRALDQLLQPLNAVVDITPNEEIRTATSLTRRALHVKVIQGGPNGAPLVDVVVAESKVNMNGSVCDPNAQNDGSGTATDVCPKGAIFDVARLVCVIPATSGSGFGEIIVGRPFQGPSGGTVVPLDIARKRYGRSPCLTGNQRPRYVIVGTNKADRITGTNIADRIIGRGGNDRLDGGRGNDCVEGQTGADNISGALGDDRMYGQSGNDHLNGGPGKDRLSAGSGNDTINAAFGRDRAIGGAGRDFINIATAGPAASADCGGGNDVVRINKNERTRVKGCERRHVFNDR
jgi:hypothetical protein